MDDSIHYDNHRKLMGSRIKALRLARELTADEAAKRCGHNITERAWTSWEGGHRTPKISLFVAIAKVLGTSPAYIAGFSNESEEIEENWGYVTANPPTLNTRTGATQSGFLVSDNIAFLKNDLTERGLEHTELVLLNVPDSSMAPDLPKGSQVLINRNDTHVENADIYAIKEPDGRVWLRWIRKELGGRYALYANDKTHSPDQILNEDAFKELDLLGRYVWVGNWRDK